MKGIAVVFGASGGIGSAVLDELRRSGRFERVIALSRSSQPALDLTNEASLLVCAEHVRDLGREIRLLFDATGALTVEGRPPEKNFRDIDPAQLAQSFAVNAIGPALLMKHFLPLLPRQGKCMFATLSARVGSIGDNRLGGWYSYRASKAALNQFVRTAAVELARRNRQAICVALHPGTVRTPLTEGFAKTGLEVQESEIAASRILSVLDRLSASDSGGFFDHRGEVVPW